MSVDIEKLLQLVERGIQASQRIDLDELATVTQELERQPEPTGVDNPEDLKRLQERVKKFRDDCAFVASLLRSAMSEKDTGCAYTSDGQSRNTDTPRLIKGYG